MAERNGSYSAAKAIEIGKRLQEMKYLWFEEPCPWEEKNETIGEYHEANWICRGVHCCTAIREFWRCDSPDASGSSHAKYATARDDESRQRDADDGWPRSHGYDGNDGYGRSRRGADSLS